MNLGIGNIRGSLSPSPTPTPVPSEELPPRESPPVNEPLNPRIATKVASGSQQYVQRQEALSRGELYTDEGASISTGAWTEEPMTNRSNEDWESLLKEESDFIKSSNRSGQLNILSQQLN